jgi:hypothetical protein
MIDWRPRIVYGPEEDETDLELELPQRPWSAIDAHTGGGNKSAIGIRETYTIRDEDLHEVVLRITEDELASVREWLRWARGTGQPFLWHPDRDEEDAYTVDLERPGPNDEIRAERTEYGATFELTITLRLLESATVPPYYVE